LDILLKCLSFDFAGTSLDEAGEDTGMVQVNYIFVVKLYYALPLIVFHLFTQDSCCLEKYLRIKRFRP
jgi:hypothetical protein